MALSDTLATIQAHLTSAQQARAAASAASAAENAADDAVGADLQTALDAIAAGKVLVVPEAATLPVPTGGPANPLTPVVSSLIDSIQVLVDGASFSPSDNTDVKEGVAFLKSVWPKFAATARFLLASSGSGA